MAADTATELPPTAASVDAERETLSRMSVALWRRYVLSIAVMVVALVGTMLLGNRAAHMAVHESELQAAAARVRSALPRLFLLMRLDEDPLLPEVARINGRLDQSVRQLATGGGPRVKAVLGSDAGGRSYLQVLEEYVADVDGWTLDGRDLLNTRDALDLEPAEALTVAASQDAGAWTQRRVLMERALLAVVLATMLLKALLVFRPGSRAIGAALRSLYDQKRDLDAARLSAEAQALHLEHALADGEQLRREQAEFTYAISHDLKSPANTIGLLLHEIEAERANLSADGREMLAMAQETVIRMQKLVDSVLDYSRVTGQVAPDEAVPLESAIVEALADLKADIASAGAEIGFRGPFPRVRGDAVLTRLLIQNLVSNAIKFRLPERAPKVTISCDGPDAEGLVRLSVADNGIGIADADRGRIFGLFQRLHLADEYPGSGIGLALCRRIVTGVGGDIKVRSRPGQGSTFDVRLPARVA
jgi:signal transduction histidine kinase